MRRTGELLGELHDDADTQRHEQMMRSDQLQYSHDDLGLLRWRATEISRN